jgi:hypothetical protein
MIFGLENVSVTEKIYTEERTRETDWTDEDEMNG